MKQHPRKINFLNFSDFSFVLIKRGRILYKSKSQGLKPLIFCLKKRKKDLNGAIVFDKIVGQAAALLLVLGRVKTVMTPLVSQRALGYLKKNRVKVIYKNKVKHILNQKKEDFCPMEKLSRGKTRQKFWNILKKQKLG